jgi:serine phosphatase RsbU (regulator of sigma subunit)/anti-sigma regulatory factor (Ser/Thr protein kinase)
MANPTWIVDAAGGDPRAVGECFEAVPALLFAFAGPNHIVTAVNAAGRAFIGDRPDPLGRPLRDVVPEWAGQQLFEAVDRVYADGRPTCAHEWRVQFDHDGDGELEERFVDFTLVPRYAADGSVHGVVGVAHDVTPAVSSRRAAERRYRAASSAVETLQNALLPADLPVLPGYRLAARYLVAGRGQTAGGDWFDALTLDDGRLALIVGDVVGHGVAASVVMSQLRAVLLELLTSGAGLAEALTRLGRFVPRVPGGFGTTVCVVLLDQADGRLEYATCGHPPPLIVGTDVGVPAAEAAPARFLPLTRGAPLGVGPPVLRVDRLAPGEVLVLYSDGLVERADRPLPRGLEDLAAVAADAARNRALPLAAPVSVPERVSRQVVELMTRTGYSDDVTVLVAHRLRAESRPLELEVRARPTELARIRVAVGAWLDDLDVNPDDHFGVQLAVTEAATNAVEHAYQGQAPGLVRIAGGLGPDGRVEVLVADSGRWREAPLPGDRDRGRGLAMIDHVTESLRVLREPGGTTVVLRRRLRHPAVLASTPGSPGMGAGAVSPPGFGIEFTAAGVLAVRGAIDLGTAADLKARMWQAWAGGSRELVVDLDGVTQLASAGVHVLHQALRGTEGPTRIRLHAGPGSAARYVLELVGLPVD